MTLITDPGPDALRSRKCEAHIKVLVRRFTPVSGNRVNVHVEDGTAANHVSDPCNSGLLKHLAPGGPDQVILTVDVPAKLQPFVQLAVVGKQDRIAGRVNNPA